MESDRKRHSSAPTPVAAPAPVPVGAPASTAPVPVPAPAPVPAPPPPPAPAPAPAPTQAPATAPTPATAPSTSSQTWDDFIKYIVNSSTITFIYWFIVFYILIHAFRKIYAPRNVSSGSAGLVAYSRSIDMVLYIMLIAGGYYLYKQMPSTDNVLGYTIELTYNFFNDPYILLETIIFTVIFFVMVYVLRFPMAPELKPIFVHLIEDKIWIVYLCIIIIMFFKYILNIQILDILFQNKYVLWLENLQPYQSSPGSAPGFFSSLTSTPSSSTPSSSTPSPSSTPSTVPSSTPSGNQVFNVGNNNYTFDEAQTVCNLFGAKLANYDQIEDTYKAGGEWCNYGWSQGQMAYFPTQKGTWNNLQNDPKTQNACGRPGINGGFIANPYVRFGANCYGIKPKQPNSWYPNEDSIPVSPVSAPSPATSQSTNTLIEKALNTMRGFNNTQWTRY